VLCESVCLFTHTHALTRLTTTTINEQQGDLFQFLHRDEWAPQRKMVKKRWNVLMLKIAKDIAKGCAFLHSANPPVIHRDLKSPNVLVRPRRAHTRAHTHTVYLAFET
jgi:serine/threonine protein kinase